VSLGGPSRDSELRRVYREHVDAVFAFFAYSIPQELAEDLTASTFERAIRAWQAFDPRKGSERAWLLTIARNLLMDHYRRQRHRDTVSTDEHPGLLEGAAADDWLERRLTLAELQEWLGQLGQREREVLALRYGADMRAADIANVLELSEANVHQIVSRALRRLRQAAGHGIS
jgi:RNA polymerase sigma-70 factor (ECF subfamily)